eukprot:SAG31_NODE_732_length_12494_cov_3.395482_6_plen_103_part_00
MALPLCDINIKPLYFSFTIPTQMGSCVQRLPLVAIERLEYVACRRQACTSRLHSISGQLQRAWKFDDNVNWSALGDVFAVPAAVLGAVYMVTLSRLVRCISR